MKIQKYGIIGISGVIISTLTIIIMAELRSDGYNHFHKAISELGSLDAPQKWIFNSLGYIIPGFLFFLFSKFLRDDFMKDDVKSYPFYFLMLAGLFQLLAGIFPLDLVNRNSTLTIFHSIGSLGSGIFWLVAALTIWWQLRKRNGWKRVAIVLFLIPFITILVVSFIPKDLPGLAQRITFSGYYLYLMILATKQIVSTPISKIR